MITFNAPRFSGNDASPHIHFDEKAAACVAAQIMKRHGLSVDLDAAVQAITECESPEDAALQIYRMGMSLKRKR